MAGTLNDSLKGMSPAEAASARSFSRIVVSAIRAAANPNDPNQAFAQALLGDVLGQAGQQDAAQMPQIPAPYVPPAPSPAAEPAETAEPAAPTEPPAPAETPPPVESVPPGPVLPLTDTTLFDAAGHLQPGIVDTSAPTAVQAQQLADQLQQRGLTADEAASEAARYIGSSAASVPRDSAEPTAPEPLPPVADDTTPGAVGSQPSGPSDEPPRRVEIIGSKPVKDALGNIYQTDANGGQRVYLTNGSILILSPEQAATISVDQAGAGAAVLMDAALLSRLALVARAGVALLAAANPVTLGIGAAVVVGGMALYLWRSQSGGTVDLDSDTRFEQHPNEPFGTVYEKSANGDWEAMPGRFKLVQGAGRYMLLSEDEIARYGQPITTPAQPPGPSGPPALPVPAPIDSSPPPSIALDVIGPTIEALPEEQMRLDDLIVESRGLVGGTPEHKSAAWQMYQARDGQWSYDRWSITYEQNQVRAVLANAAAEEYRQQLGWGAREVTLYPIIDGELAPRRLDIVDESTRRAIEYKTGYQSASVDNLWELRRDAELVNRYKWSVEWVFRDSASQPLLDALDKAGIKYRMEP